MSISYITEESNWHSQIYNSKYTALDFETGDLRKFRVSMAQKSLRTVPESQGGLSGTGKVARKHLQYGKAKASSHSTLSSVIAFSWCVTSAEGLVHKNQDGCC